MGNKISFCARLLMAILTLVAALAVPTTLVLAAQTGEQVWVRLCGVVLAVYSLSIMACLMLGFGNEKGFGAVFCVLLSGMILCGGMYLLTSSYAYILLAMFIAVVICVGVGVGISQLARQRT